MFRLLLQEQKEKGSTMKKKLAVSVLVLLFGVAFVASNSTNVEALSATEMDSIYGALCNGVCSVEYAGYFDKFCYSGGIDECEVLLCGGNCGDICDEEAAPHLRSGVEYWTCCLLGCGTGQTNGACSWSWFTCVCGAGSPVTCTGQFWDCYSN